MSLHLAKPAHEALYQDLIALLRKYHNLEPKEMLAVAGNMVGKLIAMQDQRKVTPAEALEIVSLNIEYGNKQILDQLMKDPPNG